MKLRVFFLFTLMAACLHSNLFLSAQIVMPEPDTITDLAATTKAAENGDAKAQYALACYYYLGNEEVPGDNWPDWTKKISVTRDQNTSFNWFEKAVKQNFFPAMIAYGTILITHDTTSDLYDAADMVLHKQTFDEYTAQDMVNNLPAYHQIGVHVDKNSESIKQGLSLLNIAVKKNYPLATRALADMYLFDRVSDRNALTKELKLREKAAALGDMESMLATAIMYERGVSYKVTIDDDVFRYNGAWIAKDDDVKEVSNTMFHNKKKSIQWYKKAAAAGSQQAIDKLHSMGLQ